MNQTINEQMESHVVKVAGGSGVLIQPMTENYTYVLTAKHNLLTVRDDPTSGLKPTTQLAVIDPNGRPLNILKVIPDENEQRDIAILLVDYYVGCTITKYEREVSLMRDEVWFYGYPQTRRDTDHNEDSLSHYVLIPQTDANSEIVYGNSNNADIGQISGMSGGPIFYLDDQQDTALLSAIETSMDGDTDLETHGRLKGVPIREFERLIDRNNYDHAPLAPLLPKHLLSFEHFIDTIFLLEDSDEQNLAFLKNHLRRLANRYFVTGEITPLAILDKYTDYLKVHGRNIRELQDETMWSSFLELMILSFLLDEQPEVNADFIADVIKCRRLTYIAVDKTWQRLAQEILCSEYKKLKEGGTIVIRTLKASRTPVVSPTKLKRMLRDISKGINDYRLIDNAEKNVGQNYRIVDLGALHVECIECKDDEYESFDIDSRDALNMKLIQEYGNYLAKPGCGQ